MTKHIPDVPPANRSKKGPRDHHEVASDTAHDKHPVEMNTLEGAATRPRVRAAMRRDENAEAGRIDEMQRNQSMLGERLRPGADTSQMTRIAQGDDREAVCARALRIA